MASGSTTTEAKQADLGCLPVDLRTGQRVASNVHWEQLPAPLAPDVRKASQRAGSAQDGTACVAVAERVTTALQIVRFGMR
jgi:hypothetical protein